MAARARPTKWSSRLPLTYIVITTGTFTTEARREATRDGVPPIELIDGEKLIDMLENLELGLRPVTTFEINHPFFNEFKEV